MNSKFNTKRISYLPSKKIIQFLSIVIFLLITIFFIYNVFKDRNIFIKSIQSLSLNFNYQLKFYEINNLNKVDSLEVIKIIKKHLDQSIFLIPLNKISDSLNDLTWVKEVTLSTNLKDTIKVEILEFEPIGLYFFNDQIYYFSKKGIIIDKYNDNPKNSDLILFHGNQSLMKAPKILKIINNMKLSKSMQITDAFYVNERRWDMVLGNEIFIYLSEIDIEDSIKNYIKIIENLKDSEIILIKSIDLRNNKKAIIRFK